jgi:hypothetical protein
MSRKSLVMLGFIIGSYAGGWVPTLFGADWFSMWSIVGNAVGGLLGIFISYKLTADF